MHLHRHRHLHIHTTRHYTHYHLSFVTLLHWSSLRLCAKQERSRSCKIPRRIRTQTGGVGASGSQEEGEVGHAHTSILRIIPRRRCWIWVHFTARLPVESFFFFFIASVIPFVHLLPFVTFSLHFLAKALSFFALSIALALHLGMVQGAEQCMEMQHTYSGEKEGSWTYGGWEREMGYGRWAAYWLVYNGTGVVGHA